MKPKVLLALCLVLSLCLHYADSHGWLQSPVPRSGGGDGTGNASTQPPCGKAGPTTITGTYTTGSNLTVVYKRANGHGASCNCVNFTLSYTAATTTPTTQLFDAGTVLASGLLMDTTVGTSQSASIKLPATAGNAVLQFKWRASDGGVWYDCAYITLQAPAGPDPCATSNGGCDTNAQCTRNGTAAVCACKVGFYGDGKSCKALPADVSIKLVLNTTTTGITLQDPLTDSLASLLNIPVGRILYDSGQKIDNVVVVNLAISANTTTGESGEVPARRLRTLISQSDTSLNNLTFPVYSVQVVGIDASPVILGQPISSSSGSTSGTDATGVIVGAVISFAVISALLIYAQYLRRSSKYHQSTVHIAKSSPAPAPAHAPAHAHAAAASAVAAHPPTIQQIDQPAYSSPRSDAPLPAGWARYLNDDGIPYFYNESTGESVWTRPT